MGNWTRREVVQTGLAAAVGSRVLRRPRRSPEPAIAGRERLLLDFGWRFHLGDADDPALDFGYGHGEAYAKTGELFAPARGNFNDNDWEPVDLPHDWAVALPFVDDPQLVAQGSKPLGRDYPGTSIGWYRRVFQLPADDLGRRISLEFDGVFRDALVSINDHFLGRHQSGYAPFSYDVTDLVNYGGRNIVVLRVDATEHEGWFYEGAGIYRHVWLVKSDPCHVERWGTYVSSVVQRDAALLTVATELANQADDARALQVISRIVGPDGATVSSTTSRPGDVAAWSGATIRQQIRLTRPTLWSVDHPAIYHLETRVLAGGTELDRVLTPFGVRSVRFDADQGMLLNGERVELKGTCNHQDHAGVGSALPDRLQWYRVERLKAMGSNAYRTSHNPPTPELLAACDALGMLVLDETRTMSSEPEALTDFAAMIRRDRNHPCVFAWSIGNEEPDQGTDRGARIATTMKRLARRLDPSRMVTEAMNGSWGRGLSSVVDVQGFNYGDGARMDAFHASFPTQPCMGTEVASTVSTRGIYADDKTRGYLAAYDVHAPPWGATAESWWPTYAARPWLAGGFVWTGFDYRGEPTPYAWPCISSHFGIMDTCGFPKDNFFYYQAWWGKDPVLHLFPHWNWPGKEGTPVDVWVHSNLDRVELLLNSSSLGSKPVPRNGHVAWQVPYAAGVLEARGFRDEETTAALTDRRETTGPAAGIVLHADRTTIDGDGTDVAVITVSASDSAGRPVPVADNEITFAVSGEGRLLGVGNGDPSSHEPDNGAVRRLFNGWCCAMVQSGGHPGTIGVSASSPGLRSATLSLTASPAAGRPAVP
jgi:beta-galactosidase